MSGTIGLALTQQLDEFGEPLSGGQLFFIQAGTVSTPQNAYQDSALTIPMPNPITLDAAGRVPQFFLADGYIKVRLQDRTGVVKFVADFLLVIGPSGGTGSAPSVDATTIMQTGDIKIRYDNAQITGFVRANGRTIGDSASGATELADGSALALFTHLWTKDATLTVAPGPRTSAAADWGAHKTIVLPDGRNRLLMALGDMGNADVGLLAGVTFGKGNGITLGSTPGGAMRKTLGLTEIPSHSHNAFVKINDIGHSHTYDPQGGGIAKGTTVAGGLSGGSASTSSNTTGITANVGSSAGLSDNKTANVGGGAAFDLVVPSLLITVYLKL